MHPNHNTTPHAPSEALQRTVIPQLTTNTFNTSDPSDILSSPSIKKVLYFDIESTGLNHYVNEIVQFAAIIEIDGVVVDQVNLKCRPLNTDNITERALEITGFTREEMAKWPHPSKVVEQIVALFDKHIDRYNKNDKFYPCGHNVAFDLDFLNILFIRNGYNYGTGSYQNWRAMDTRGMANILLFDEVIDVPDVKLETLCKYFGIPIKAHDAFSDIKATRELLFVLRRLL